MIGALAATAAAALMMGHDCVSAAAAHAAQAHHPVSTTSAAAQAAFDEGLTLLYSYNRGAARAAFERARAADPKLAMAYWGIAQSLGSNINISPSVAEIHNAYAALRKAHALRAGGAERAYIAALDAKFTSAAKPDTTALAAAYEKAMRGLRDAYPDDVDAATLWAESAMELHPWALYTVSGRPITGTDEIVAVLEGVMRRAPMHIGANHFYIHDVEASTTPERGLASAMRLGSLQFQPAAAHLVHMPAHIYMRAGDFAHATATNECATMHDRDYLHAHDDREASGYYGHNETMLAYGYMMDGRYADAQRVAKSLADQGSLVPLIGVDVRFHRWHEILALPAPAKEATAAEPLRAAFLHFARGMALASGGDLVGAQAELAAVDAAQAAQHIQGSAGNNNSSHDLYGLAHDVLSAKIAGGRGDWATAAAALTAASARQDALLYIEPPDWYFPVRESLGAVLLKSGDATGAVRVFRADLERNARNPRTLFGLAQALDAAGKHDDAAFVRAQFNAAWAGPPLTLDDLL